MSWPADDMLSHFQVAALKVDATPIITNVSTTLLIQLEISAYVRYDKKQFYKLFWYSDSPPAQAQWYNYQVLR